MVHRERERGSGNVWLHFGTKSKEGDPMLQGGVVDPYANFLALAGQFRESSRVVYSKSSSSSKNKANDCEEVPCSSKDSRSTRTAGSVAVLSSSSRGSSTSSGHGGMTIPPSIFPSSGQTKSRKRAPRHIKSLQGGSSSLGAYLLPVNPKLGQKNRSHGDRCPPLHPGQHAAESLAMDVLRDSLDSVTKVRQAYKRIRRREEELAAVAALEIRRRARKSSKEECPTTTSSAVSSAQLASSTVLDPAVHLIEGLVYRRDCLDEVRLIGHLNEIRRRLRSGQSVRLSCHLQDNEGSEENCKLLLKTIFSRMSIFCSDPAPPNSSLRVNKEGIMSIDMVPAKRFCPLTTT
jgi:hypothetical protein